MNGGDNSLIVWILLGVVLLVMLFAQARLFSIDATLKQILAKMSEDQQGGDKSHTKEPHPLDSYVG